MKSFLISVCVVVIIFASVIVNSFLVKHSTVELIEKVSSLDDNYESYDSLVKLWGDKSFLLNISASAKETDKIEDMISAIGSHYKTADFSGFEEKKSLLINYIRLIQSHEKINIENII